MAAPTITIESRRPVERPAARRAEPAARRRLSVPKVLMVASDAAVVVLAMVAAYTARAAVEGGEDVTGAFGEHLALGAAALPAWLITFARRRLYNVRFLDRRLDELRRLAAGSALATALMAVAAYGLQLPVSRAWLGLTLVFAVVLLGTEREVARRVFGALRRRGRLLRPVVIVGSNEEAFAVGRMLDEDPMLGYRVVGYVDDHDETGSGRVLGPVGEALAVIRRTGASSVILAASATSLETSNRLVRELLRAGVHVELSSTLRDIAAHRLTVRALGRHPVTYVEPCDSAGWRAVAKRSLDITIASIALLAIAPVVAIIAVAIKLDSRGPVVFRQRRVGRDGEEFELCKFRSMVEGAHDHWFDLREQADPTGPIFKIKNDPRITRVGRLLRKSSLDELPQLWNVLRGEMSLVGPRPALPEEVVLWDEQLHDRLRVRPGVTGMWQVSGRSDAADDYSRLDLYYVDNWSLLTDLVIVLKTIPVVLFGRGAY